MAKIEKRIKDCKNTSYFLKYSLNITSQGGEDGILQEIFQRIQLSSKLTCIDIGSWDGKHLSNTFTLLTLKGWYGILCEADPIRSSQSIELYKNNEKVKILSVLVNSEGENSLLSILQNNSIHNDFDFLSIDVDGNDYHIWKSLGNLYNPRVVCIEFNPTIPNHIVFIQENDIQKQQGSSLLALVELGETLGTYGYSLVCTTTFNAIFVRNDLMKYLPNCDYSLAALHDSTMITDIFQTYDGELKLCGPKKLIWHKVAINVQNIQPLKKKMRVFPFAPPNQNLNQDSSISTKSTNSLSKKPIDIIENLLVGILQFNEKITYYKNKHLLECITISDIESFRINFIHINKSCCDIIKSQPFEVSNSPLYEIIIDILLWCVLLICQMNYNLITINSLQKSNHSLDNINETGMVSILLRYSFESIQQIAAIFYSIGNYYEIKKLNYPTIIQSYYQQSLYIYCIYDYYLLVANQSTNIPSISEIHQELINEISNISNLINSLINISKNKLDTNESDDTFIRKPIWKIFEKGYWLWLTKELKSINTSKNSTRLNIDDLMTESLSKKIEYSLRNRLTVEKNNYEDPIENIEQTKHLLFDNLPKNITNVNTEMIDSQKYENIDESLAEISSRIFGRINLQEKYEAYKRDIEQKNQIEVLQNQIVRYQNMNRLLIGFAVGTISLVSFAWIYMKKK